VRSRIVLSFLIACLPAVSTGCGEEAEAGSPRIVAAFYPLAYAAERIAPGSDVSNLTPVGAEPHDLELTARDVERIRDADHVLYLGSGFMPALEDAVSDDEGAVDLLPAADVLQRDGDVDPHVWLDPARYGRLAERIAERLGKVDGASNLVHELEALDVEFREGLADCERRAIVTSHAAFSYLADAYDLEQIALTGASPEAEPSAKAIEGLVAEIEETGATTVFFEPLVSAELARTVAREAGVTTAVLNPLEGLTADEIDAGADYFDVMRENLDALRSALGCS
jgi:zinc transport system substrate-binding protein